MCWQDKDAMDRFAWRKAEVDPLEEDKGPTEEEEK